jgi:hypothetical protein
VRGFFSAFAVALGTVCMPCGALDAQSDAHPGDSVFVYLGLRSGMSSEDAFALVRRHDGRQVDLSWCGPPIMRGTPAQLRAWALRGAGALWACAVPADRARIQAALEAGARDPNPHVRVGAAMGLADVLHGLQDRDGATPGADPERDAAESEPEREFGLPLEQEDGRVDARGQPLAPQWLLGALVPLLADPVPGVRRAARVAARVLVDAPRS